MAGTESLQVTGHHKLGKFVTLQLPNILCFQLQSFALMVNLSIHLCLQKQCRPVIFWWNFISPFRCLADIHLMIKHKPTKIVIVTCTESQNHGLIDEELIIDVKLIYLCVWLNLCINRLPSANLIWILVAGTESSIRTGALRMDLSSSSGDEGVLTISGVRLDKWKKKQNKINNTYIISFQTLKFHIYFFCNCVEPYLYLLLNR